MKLPFPFEFRWRYKRRYDHITPNRRDTAIDTGALELDRLSQKV
jgi:hypothetical protein